MKLRNCFTLLLLGLVLPLMVAQSCAPTAVDDDTPSLTTDEANAAQAAVSSSATLAQATSTTQNGAPIGNDDAQARTGTADTITFGTCPAVTLGPSGDALLDFTVTIDFADGCAALGSDDYICSGSATGTLSQTAKSLDLTFNDIGCNDNVLGGTANLAYDRADFDVSLDGDWDLARTYNDWTTETDGNGRCAYDGDTFISTIETFDGTVTDDYGSWSLSADEIQVSIAETGTAIPFAGEMTVSGSDIRTVTIRFDENSPSTGEVEVSINGSAFFPVDLDEL